MNKDIITVEVAGTRLETTNPTLALLVLTSAGEDQAEHASTSGRIPAIGQPWPEQGGIYAGLMRGAAGKPDYHLVVPAGPKGFIAKVAWGGYEKDEAAAGSEYDGYANTRALVNSKHSHPAAEWAAELEIEGHTDFYLPSRRELALCYANVPELFEKAWHWSSTQYSPYSAWIQLFDGGFQSLDHKSNEFRARAVRRVVTP